MKVGQSQNLNQKALGILLLEVIFGTITYEILRRPYNGELWIRIIFWLAFIISALAFAISLKLGWLLATRKRPKQDYKVAAVLVFINLLFIVALNFIYWLHT